MPSLYILVTGPGTPYFTCSVARLPFSGLPATASVHVNVVFHFALLFAASSSSFLATARSSMPCLATLYYRPQTAFGMARGTTSRHFVRRALMNLSCGSRFAATLLFFECAAVLYWLHLLHSDL